MPVRLLTKLAPLDVDLRLLVEPGRCLNPEHHRASLGQLQRTPLLSHDDRVGPEVHQVTAPIPDIIASGSDSLAPVFIRPAFWELHIATSQTHALAVDAGEIGLAAYAGAVAGIERVVPNVQLPRIGRVDGANEVYRGHEFTIWTRHVVGHVHDVFVGTDAAEGWDLLSGQLGRVELQSPAAVRRAGEGSLGLGPLEGI